MKKLEMMHTSDYANMGIDQMERKLGENKQKDQTLAQSFQ